MTTDAKADAKAFLRGFRQNLLKVANANTPGLASRWQEKSIRTHLLKGDAVRKGPVRKRQDSVLYKTLIGLGYNQGNEAIRFFEFEWFRKDLMALDCRGQMQRHAAWRGNYTIDVVCEVENDLAEFMLTVRGMLDLRARLYVGIFFSNDPDPEIGEFLWNPAEPGLKTRMSEWSPPKNEEWGIIGAISEGTELLLIIVDVCEPVMIRRAECWVIRDCEWQRAEI